MREGVGEEDSGRWRKAGKGRSGCVGGAKPVVKGKAEQEKGGEAWEEDKKGLEKGKGGGK